MTHGGYDPDRQPALGALDRGELERSQAYADLMTAEIADVEALLDGYREAFGEPPQRFIERLSKLKASAREAKADAARLASLE